GPKVFN
ncbi:hypothetical protein FOXB_04975, partial [Fusarium oxysporum f. sp. conglutinans Fo5176]